MSEGQSAGAEVFWELRPSTEEVTAAEDCRRDVTRTSIPSAITILFAVQRSGYYTAIGVARK
jgi:hypothetical protein